MEDTFEHGDDGNGGRVAGEVASIEQDWSVVTAMLPAQWQAKATELGAVRRLRGFASIEALLRVLLIHLADGCSLRETVVRARAGNLADVSDVALLKRLRGVVSVDGAGDGGPDGLACGDGCVAARSLCSFDGWQCGV